MMRESPMTFDEKIKMTLSNSTKFLMISLLLLTGCATSTGQPGQSDCPPGHMKIQDEDSGKYDCASEKEYDEMSEVFEEQDRRP